MAVRVDVEWVGTGDRGQVRDLALEALELERSANGTSVAEQGCRSGPAREVQIGSSVRVTVEGGHSATDEELPAPVVDVLHARGVGLLDELRHRDAGLLASGASERRAGESDSRHRGSKRAEDGAHP